MKKEIIKIEGMMCEHCEHRVEEAIKKIDGIHMCTANAKDDKAIVEYDEEKTGIAEIKETIESIGYDVVL